ncbi:hypothetical protein [Nonomuraea rubra]|uniref:hypothetical protein n=1 Tax=Nonomuraea rubra TaxID=46180 RepID=UPI0033DB974C
MRGQEPGSEHDRREADRSAVPATPPPSFGQTDGQDVPAAFAPSGEADAPVPPVLQGSASGEETSPGAQPWEVPGDDAAPYDWFSDPTHPDPTHPGPTHPGHGPSGPPQPDQHAFGGQHQSPEPPTGHHAFAPQPPAWEPPTAQDGTQASQADQPHGAHGTQQDQHVHPHDVQQDQHFLPQSTPADQPFDAQRAQEAPAHQPFTPPAYQEPFAAPPAGFTPFGTPESDHPWQADDDQTRPGRIQDIRPWDQQEHDPGQDTGRWPAEPVVPGAPPWEPPPAFTAAAAGMPAWPAPISDPHAMPPWPAATGELEAEPDEPSLPPPFDPNATNPEGFARPAHYFDPEAAKLDAAHHPAQSTPAPTEQDATNPTGPRPAFLTADATTPPDGEPPATHPSPGQGTAQDAAHPSPGQGPTPDTGQDQPPTGRQEDLEPDDTRLALPFPAAPGAHPPPLGAPVATEDPAADQPPAHYFDPNANQSTRPPEPGDVPVWPPTPPTGDKLPELPFSRETWGQRPSTSLDLPRPPAGGPAFPPGAFKQPPFQTPPPPPPPAKSKRALLVTLGALALAGVATGGFFAFQAVSGAPPTTAAARSTAPPSAATAQTPPPDAAGTSILNSEQTDPQKLSLSEAFPKKKVGAAGTTFTRVKADMETTCEKAATGEFADALKEQKCSRVLRATYVDSKRRYAVTTGIAVLPDRNAAATADQAKNLSRNIWFRPLPGPEKSGGERVHIAGGYASGLVWGRYIVFSYATHADGHTPEAKDKTLPKVSGAFRDQTSLVLERRITKG